MAHGEDLRQTGAPDTLVEAVIDDWHKADLSETDRAICAYVEMLTLTPAQMSRDDLTPMREAGLDDLAIHDVCAVTAYFAYINRIADGLGVDLEPGMNAIPPWEQ